MAQRRHPAEPALPVAPAVSPGRTWMLMWIAFGLLQSALFWLDVHPGVRRLIGDEEMYLSLARGLAAGQGAAIDPLWPPLYVWLLAPFTNFGAWSLLLVAAVQLGMLVAASFLFRSAIGALTDAHVGRAMQAFVLLDPQLGAFAHYLWPEIPFLLLFAVVFWCVVYGARPWSWIGAGVALGAALLTKSVIEPFAPVFALGAASGFGWRRGSLRTIGIIGLALLVAMPVIVGNHRRHGIWTIADSSRFNLWLGLNAVGRRSAVGRTAGDEYRAYLESGSTFLERQAALGRRIAAFVQARGPGNLLRHQLSTQYFRLLDKDSMLTEQLAGGAYRRANLGYTARSGWLSSGLRALSYGVYGLALAAAGPGFVLAWRTRSVWLRVLCCWLAYGLLLFLVLEARSRFRIVFLPSIYAAASCALIHRRRLAFVSPVDRLIGVSLAVGALWFAFGGSLLPLEVR